MFDRRDLRLLLRLITIGVIISGAAIWLGVLLGLSLRLGRLAAGV